MVYFTNTNVVDSAYWIDNICVGKVHDSDSGKEHHLRESYSEPSAAVKKSFCCAANLKFVMKKTTIFAVIPSDRHWSFFTCQVFTKPTLLCTKTNVFYAEYRKHIRVEIDPATKATTPPCISWRQLGHKTSCMRMVLAFRYYSNFRRFHIFIPHCSTVCFVRYLVAEQLFQELKHVFILSYTLSQELITVQHS